MSPIHCHGDKPQHLIAARPFHPDWPIRPSIKLTMETEINHPSRNHSKSSSIQNPRPELLPKSDHLPTPRIPLGKTSILESFRDRRERVQ